MSAAPAAAAVVRYDTACAYCRDGEPVARHRGKAACARCLAAFAEGATAHEPPRWTARRSAGILPGGELVVPEWRLRALIRHVLGLGRREYVRSLWERALIGRGALR